MIGPKTDIKSYDKYPNWKAFKLAMTEVKKHRVALDIGAHIGTMAVPLSQHFNTVHAFEPMYYEYLKQNVSDNVIIYPKGVGNKTKTEILWTCPYQSGSSSILQHPDNPYSKDAIPKEIKIIPLDLYEFINIDFIKIDVEGYEYFAVDGMRQTLLNNKPVIMIEFLRKWQPKENTYEECHNILIELGYKQVNRYKDDYIYIPLET